MNSFRFLSLLSFCLPFLIGLAAVPKASASSTVILEENFESEGELGVFTQISVGSNFNWRWLQNDFDGRFVEMNGFGADAVSDDWLILTESLDLAAYTNPVLSFKYIARFDGPNIQVKVSRDYDPGIHTDPADATWEVISFFTEGENDPESGSWSAQFSNEMDLSAYKDTAIHIGFHYVSTGTESGQGAVWRVDDFRVSNADPAAILLNTPLETEIDPWTVVNLSGGEAWGNTFYQDRDGIFVDGSFDRDGSDDWLISPTLTVAEGEIPLMNLDYYSDFSGPTVQVLVSTDYDPGVHTNPGDATWSQVHVPFSTVEPDTWASFTDISLNGYHGDSLHVAFRYQVEASFPPVARVQGLANVCIFKGTQAPALESSIAVSTTQPTTSQAIDFTALPRGGRVPYTYTWNFGDGNASEVAQPSHTYVIPGTYSVQLTVTDVDGVEVSTQRTDWITVVNEANVFLKTNFEGPADELVPSPWDSVSLESNAEWLINQEKGQTGAVITGFNSDEASDDWLIGPTLTLPEDGNPVLSVDIFSRFAGPLLQILVSQDGSSPTGSTWQNLNVDLSGLEDNAWTTVDDISLVGLSGQVTLAFRYLSNGFGSGDGRTYGVDHVTLLNAETIPPLTPMSITTSVSQATTEDPVTFRSLGSGGKFPYTYAWDFGDGSTSSGAEPSHTFALPGTYSITLTQTDALGASREATLPDAVTVIDASSILLSQDFEGFDGDIVPEPWRAVSVLSIADWELDTFDGQQGVFINGFGVDEGSDDWLISPPFAIAEGEAAVLGLDFYTFFSGGGFDILVSNDYTAEQHSDPSTATWVPISADLGGSDWSRLDGLKIPISGANVRVAFRYTSAGIDAGDGRRIGVDRVQVRKDTTVVEPPNGDAILDTDFEGADGDPIPEPWMAISVTSEARWQISDRNDRFGAFMNGFGSDTASEDWLISPAIDLSDGIPVLTFVSYARFGGPDLTVLISKDFDPTVHVDPSSATWVDMEVNFAQAVENEWATFEGISLAGLGDDSSRLAFKYVSTGTASGEGRTIGVDGVRVSTVDEAPALVVDVRVATSEVLVGDDVHFTANVSGGIRPYTFAWEFGDGETSELANPTHTYEVQRDLAASLTVTDAAGTTATAAVILSVIDPNNILLNTDFSGADDDAISAPWISYSVASDADWQIDTFASQQGAFGNGFGADAAGDDWLISPPFDIAFGSLTTLAFDYYENFSGPDLEVLISANYDPDKESDPSAVHWSAVPVDFGDAESSTWVRLSDTDLGQFSGRQCRLAFRYTTLGGETGQSKRIGIDNVRILTIIPDMPAPETYTFEEWKAVNGHFKKGDPAGAFDADPDGDGFINGIEHRFILDPKRGVGFENLPQLTRQEDGIMVLRYTRMRDQEAWGIQLSKDLQTWSDAVEGQDVQSLFDSGGLGDVFQPVEVLILTEKPFVRVVVPQ